MLDKSERAVRVRRLDPVQDSPQDFRRSRGNVEVSLLSQGAREGDGAAKRVAGTSAVSTSGKAEGTA